MVLLDQLLRNSSKAPLKLLKGNSRACLVIVLRIQPIPQVRGVSFQSIAHLQSYIENQSVESEVSAKIFAVYNQCMVIQCIPSIFTVGALHQKG